MNEQYTIEELGLGRSKEDHISEVADRVMAGDLIISDGVSTCLETILIDLGGDFTRNLMSTALDSQNPMPAKIRGAIVGKVLTYATNTVNDIKQVF